MSATYSSNCPISRPVAQQVDNHIDLGGMAWNDRIGIFFATENDLLPMKKPPRNQQT